MDRYHINERAKITDESVLVVRNLKKSFGKQEVLKGIDLDLFQGETLAIVGANGAGKSVLIETIFGIHEKDSGDVWLNLGEESWSENLRRVGIQFQQSNFSGSEKVIKLINFHLNFYKSQYKEEELKEMYEVFGLNEVLNKRVGKLSGGQKQRLNLLLAVLKKPRIMILDEFITGLDVKSVRNIIQYINKLKINNNASMIIISHQPEEIEKLSDRIIVLNEGKIQKITNIKEIYKNYIDVGQFLEEVI